MTRQETITLPLTVGTDDTHAFAFVGPDMESGLVVLEPLSQFSTVEELIDIARSELVRLLTAGYRPSRGSRTGAED